MLVLNPLTRSIELFEPHGMPKEETFDNLWKLQKYMNKNGKVLASKEITVDTWFSYNACPYNKQWGIQAYDGTPTQKREYYTFNKRIIKDPKGFCCVWSFLMLEFRLLYPTKSTLEFSKILTKKYKNYQPELWRRFIRGYTYGLTEKLKKEMNKRLSKKGESIDDIYKYHFDMYKIIGKMKLEI